MGSNIGVFGNARRPAYRAEDSALIKALIPHMQWAFRMHVHLAASEARQWALEALLQSLSTPVLLVTPACRVIFMNSAAERLLGLGDGLAVESGELTAAIAEECKALRRLVATAAQGTTPQYRGPAGAVRVSRCSGSVPLEVMSAPLAAREDWICRERGVVALFVTGAHQSAAMDGMARGPLHGLTASERRVAAALARGISGKQVCKELGISYNTLKTHLKHIYAKTGSHRQTELVRLFMGLRFDEPTAERSEGR